MRRVCAEWIKSKLASSSSSSSSSRGFNFESCVERLRQCRDLSQVRGIHREIVAAGHRGNRFLANLLVQMYGRVGSLREAEIVYEGIDEPRDDSSRLALLSAYAHNGNVNLAREVFDSLTQKPSFSWSVMLNAYAQTGHLQEAKELYDKMFVPDDFSGTILIKAFSDRQDLESAINVFDGMQTKDSVAWNALVSANAVNGHLETASEILDKMPMLGSSAMNPLLHAYSQASMVTQAKFVFEKMRERSIISMTALLTAYDKGGDYKNARIVFDKMPQHDLVSCNAIVTACSKSETQNLQELKHIFDRMHARDIVSWTILLQAYAQSGHPSVAQAMLAKLPRYDSLSATAVIEGYGKAGNLSRARAVLENLPERHLEPCTVLMEAYSRNGYPLEAVHLFRTLELEGSIEPDGAMFTTLLSACSHGGLVRLGLDYFAAMAVDHSLTPSPMHYSCVADMLGRAGLLQEVEDLAEKMPCLPIDSMWIALLNACKIHNDPGLGALAADKASQLRPGECVPYVMIAGFPDSLDRPLHHR
ncbi:pentatricopeptide repeat-containing protein At4g02750 [Selaginella moellendorffii]|nr:pentatricopeptide repeat-containing protein At4g02750 [Selaginella moellendorffii]|eukprot:XP_002991905.2 pentatricopeptide repeat-containing protein At4g02750 [Selaginella moellendorffii]